MAVEKKDRIFVGDALAIVYETRFSGEDESDYNSTPATPLTAFARVWSQQLGDFVDIGTAPNLKIGEVDITPATTLTGAILKYVVDETVTSQEGNYTVYITAEFSDGSILTENKSIRVLEFR